MLKKVLTGIVLVVLASYSEFAAAAPRQVVVSIPPQQYFVEQLGGNLVQVVSLLPAGASPHTFEPKPQQMKSLSQADLYVRIHVEFEDAWWDKFLSAKPDMYVVDSTAGVEFLAADSAHHHEADAEAEHSESAEAEHAASGRDPHIWLSPKRVQMQAETICAGLIAIDPANQETYLANKARFLQELAQLDQTIQAQLAGLRSRAFMVFHPSWAYFAADYNLTQLAIEFEGKEPSAAEMIAIIKQAQAAQIRVIFSQPQSSRRTAEMIASQLDARVATLDPLAGDWRANLLQITGLLAETLK